MGTFLCTRLRTSCLFVLGTAPALALVAPTPAGAFPSTGSDWEDLYGAIPSDARCQLCHFNENGGNPWNGYGWDIREALRNASCDLDGDGVDNFEAFICIEDLDSDMEGAFLNITEIVEGAQPGWTPGPNNTQYEKSGVNVPNQTPPTGLDPYDPGGMGGAGGTGGAGGMGGMGGMGGAGGTGGDDMLTPGQHKRRTIVVRPGRSIQAAIDQAQEGARIYVLSGVYKEGRNAQNGIEITKSGIRLIGQRNKKKRVIVKASGNQRNGIVVVPPVVSEAAQPRRGDSAPIERTDCMGCHTDMGPPFPLHPDVPIVTMNEDDPWLYDIEIKSITVEGFRNNGIFTEHVDGFLMEDVESINNNNYGIFPVLSKNGAIIDSYSTGSTLDSAIWVETSVNVLVARNFVEKSVNGIEVSNSDDILVINNEMTGNTVGAAILLLPGIFDDEGRKSAKRIDVVDNYIHDNNKENTAREGSILSFIPKGIGILHLGVDDSLIAGNIVEDNEFVGIAVTDYCAVVSGTPFPCDADPDVSIEFLYDQTAKRNRVEGNLLINNGNFDSTDPPEPPDPPFVFFAADLSLLTVPWDLRDLGLPIPPLPEQDPADLDP